MVHESSSKKSIGCTGNNSTQIVVPRRAGTTHSTMVGVDPMIRLPEFHGDGTEDPEKNLFMCERIWEEKRVTDEEKKLVQREITFRN